MSIPEIPKSLLDAYLNDELIPFVGAGLSKNCNAPLWHELLNELLDYLKNELPEFKDSDDVKEINYLLKKGPSAYLIVAGYLKQKLAGKMDDFIINRFENLKYSPTHKLLAELDLNKIITTNFDSLIENAFNKERGINLKIAIPKNKKQEARLPQTKNWIFKIHGSASTSSNIVLANEDYENIEKSTIESLSTLLQNHTILFLGYGLEDQYIMNQFKLISKIYEGANRRHYALLNEEDAGRIIKDDVLKRFNIQIISYKISSPDRPEIYRFLEQFKNIKKIADTEKKYLIIIKGHFNYGLHGDEINILVRDNNPLWGITKKMENGSEYFERAFLLPSISYVETSSENLKLRISDLLGIDNSSFEIEIESKPFKSTKHNPSTNNITLYEFYFIKIKFNQQQIAFTNPVVIIGNTKYYWKTLEGLRAHEATKKMNREVIVELSTRFGGMNLDFIESSFMQPIAFNDDPYDYKANSYDSQYWVKDEKVFDIMISKNSLKNVKGILDLGCGTGLLGSYLKARNINIPYCGLDTASKMIKIASDQLRSYNNCIVINKDIINDEIDEKCDEYLFVFKNVFHLMSPLRKAFLSLDRRFGKPTRILIVETVSPDINTLSHIQNIFELIGVQYKRNWFVEGQIKSLIDSWKFSNYEVITYDQYIEVDRWLDTFNLNDVNKTEVKSYILTMPAEIQSKIMKFDDGVLKLLRRQEIIAIEPS